MIAAELGHAAIVGRCCSLRGADRAAGQEGKSALDLAAGDERARGTLAARMSRLHSPAR